jgi:hypothetical protein
MPQEETGASRHCEEMRGKPSSKTIFTAASGPVDSSQHQASSWLTIFFGPADDSLVDDISSKHCIRSRLMFGRRNSRRHTGNVCDSVQAATSRRPTLYPCKPGRSA